MIKAVENPSYKKRLSYHSALLGGFAMLSATFLIMGNLSTEQTIAQRVAEDLQASLSQVVPDSIHDNNLLDNLIHVEYKNQDIIVYQAIKNDRATAVAYSISGQGYAGEIRLIIGINADGEILGVRVLSHAETPGLGDKIEEKKDDWIFGFNGMSFSKLPENSWKVKKDGGVFDQFSGATITPRGVVHAIKDGLTLFKQKQHELLSIQEMILDKPETKTDKTVPADKTEGKSNEP